ncbi:DUF5687 family protein [Lutibacter flavus]|uniref:ABC-2 type transport system permease protein n=1 Tax=Lutibacter flavus TaxID=691689 RepID=A0A238X2M3_9FLAO|nr:DUF5687 family protein [Lutibacter flavus]SNR52833.1 hypothetical protein SAMN04488111_1482 [Lutibacter flavus]
MIKHFLNFEWKQFFRSSYWQKSIALNILLGFFALYMILSFLVLGVAIYPLLKKEYPESDPLIIVNGFLFYWFLADLVMRFFLQKLPVMNVKPFLVLPLKRSKIVNYVLQKSALSFFNFLPLFAVIPFGVVLIFEDYSLTTALIWMLTMVVFSLIINFVNFIIESKSAETELSFLPIIVIATALFALNYFEIVSFSKLVASAMNAITENPFLVTVPILVLIGVYLANFSILKQKLYIDSSLKAKTEIANTSNLEWTKKFGSIAPFLQLDLKLLWRNKRPRSSIFILAIGLLYGLFFYPNPMYSDLEWLYVFVGVFVTGIFMINFGQFIPAWDSGYYKLLMSQNIKYKEYLNSKYTLMIMVSIIMFVLSIPYVYFGWKILAVHFAALIYNLGINVYILLYAGSFNRKKIDLTQRAAFNYQGTGAVQWLVGFPLLFIPVGIFLIPYFTIGFEAAVATLIILGVIGIVFHQKIMSSIVKKYHSSKYKMISAFEQNN